MKRLAIILISAVTASGCYYDNEEYLYGKESCPEGEITYSAVIAPMISQNCLTCHDQGTSSGDVVLETHAQVVQQVESGKLIGVITHSSGFPAMPDDAPQLSACKIEAVKVWIEGGALNN
jgi:hypothetical protein